MLNICVCDEDNFYNERIKNLLSDIIQDIHYVVTFYNQLEKIEQVVNENKFDFDIIISSMLFGKRSSLKLIQTINKLYPRTQVICMSRYIGMLVNIYDVDCCYFIYKEDLEERLPLAIEKARKRLNRHPDLVMIKNGKTYLVLKSEEIVYIEHFAKKCIIHTIDDSVEVTSTLKDLEYSLDARYFFHPHKSYIVNSDHIRKLTLTKLELTGGIEVPVSRNYRDGVKRFIDNHFPVNDGNKE